jgi:hypothetical protein
MNHSAALILFQALLKYVDRLEWSVLDWGKAIEKQYSLLNQLALLPEWHDAMSNNE